MQAASACSAAYISAVALFWLRALADSLFRTSFSTVEQPFERMDWKRSGWAAVREVRVKNRATTGRNASHPWVYDCTRKLPQREVKKSAFGAAHSGKCEWTNIRRG
jgi:hypothetical protein